MAVVLFVVAFAMVVAGLAAIYDGYAIVMIEKGWTKVIAGAVGASAGFLLFGIVAVLTGLKRIAATLESLRERAGGFETPPRQPAKAVAPDAHAGLAAAPEPAAAASEPDKAPEPASSVSAVEPPRRDAEDAMAAPAPAAPDGPAAPESVRPPERQAVSANEAP